MTDRMMSAHRKVIPGRCDHCEWEALTTSYPKMVKMYQNHLRAQHPTAWMKG
jgi:hypothetical protein